MAIKRKRVDRPEQKRKKGEKGLVQAKVGYISPTYMVAEIRAGRLDATLLTMEQRRACVMVMANGTMTAQELADIFSVDRRTITSDLKAIRAEIGRDVSQWTKEEILGHLVKTAEDISTQAMKKDNLALAWTIEKDMFKLFENIGLFDNREKNSLTVTIEAVGQGYKRASEIIARGLDPLMSGEIIDAKAIEKPKQETTKLPFASRLPGPEVAAT